MYDSTEVRSQPISDFYLIWEEGWFANFQVFSDNWVKGSLHIIICLLKVHQRIFRKSKFGDFPNFFFGMISFYNTFV